MTIVKHPKWFCYKKLRKRQDLPIPTPYSKLQRAFLILAFLLVQPCTLQLSQSSNNFTDQSALIAFKSSISFGPNDTVFAASKWSIMTMAIGCLVSRWASTINVLLTLNLKNILGFDSHISVISKKISHLLCMC